MGSPPTAGFMAPERSGSDKARSDGRNLRSRHRPEEGQAHHSSSVIWGDWTRCLTFPICEMGTMIASLCLFPEMWALMW